MSGVKIIESIMEEDLPSMFATIFCIKTYITDLSI